MPAALIVDENPITIMQSVDVLTRAGLLPYACDSPGEALRILEGDHAKISFLFVSAEKTGMVDGFALAKIVAARWPLIDVVVASEQRRPAYRNLPESATFSPTALSAAIVEERLHQEGVSIRAEAPVDFDKQERPISASCSAWPA